MGVNRDAPVLDRSRTNPLASAPRGAGKDKPAGEIGMSQGTAGGFAGGARAAMLAVLLLVLAALLVMVGAGQLLTHISGAANLSSDAQGRIWLTLNGELLRLDAAGNLEAQFDLEQSGIGVPATVAAMPDGRIWVGSLSQQRLYLLAADGKQLARAEPPPAAGAIFGTFHAAYEPRSDRLVIADTQNHRLLSFSGDGSFIAASGSALPVRFPNGLAADPQGRLLLADTNHNTLAWIESDLTPAAAAVEPPGPINIRGLGFWDPWPVFVSVAPDGFIYASWHGAKLLRGAVLAYSADGHYLHALPLEPIAEPQALLARADNVLVAFKSGQDFSLRQYDRSGRDLGPFGDSAVQSRLLGASARASLLRRLQTWSRLVLMLGAPALLLGALRLRRQADLAAAGAIVRLRREAPRGNTLVLVLGLGAVFILIMGLELAGLGATVHVARSARHGGSPGLQLFARLGMPLLLGLVLFGIAMGWRSTRTFLDLQTRLIRRRMQSWAPYLSGMLAPGEQIEDFGVAPGMLRGRLLIATNRRLMLLLNSAGYSRRPLWQAEWHNISEPRVLPRPWWLRLMNPLASRIEVDAGGVQAPLRLYSVSTLHAQQLIEMIRGAQERGFARTQPLHPPPVVSPAITAPPAKLPVLAVLRGALLSLLLPGLGQLDQGRTRQGLGLMLFATAILSSGLISWYIALRRVADQPLQDPLLLALLYLTVLAYAVWDAARYAREAGAATATS